LEELLPKDNENIPLPDFGPLTPSEPPGFAPDELVRCPKCNRTNAPTRVTCIYCGTPFAFDEKIASQQRPTLRPLEKWEQGYSNILVPTVSERPDSARVEEIAGLLKLSASDLDKILENTLPLPLARAATLDEARLIEKRLGDFGLSSQIVSDEELRIEQAPPQRIRAAVFEEQALIAFPMGGAEGIRIEWSDVTLLVQGRLFRRSVEVTERKSAGQNDLLSASETFADESLLDVYGKTVEGSLRIAANSFDFSCLKERKALIVKLNFASLVETFRERAANALFNDSYISVRQLLEPAWPSETQTESRGWRRERPGKVTVGAVTETSNETQFTRYSRLKHHLARQDSQ
jgi:hypothetical protein